MALPSMLKMGVVIFEIALVMMVQGRAEKMRQPDVGRFNQHGDVVALLLHQPHQRVFLALAFRLFMKHVDDFIAMIVKKRTCQYDVARRIVILHTLAGWTYCLIRADGNGPPAPATFHENRRALRADRGFEQLGRRFHIGALGALLEKKLRRAIPGYSRRVCL